MNQNKRFRKHYDLFLEFYRCRSAVAFKGLTTYREAFSEGSRTRSLYYTLDKLGICPR